MASRPVTAADIPPLEHGSGSWVVIRNSDGQAIGEFVNRKHLERFDASQVTVKTVGDYLAGLSRNQPGNTLSE